MSDPDFECTYCRQSLRADPYLLEEIFECPQCGKRLKVPQSAARRRSISHSAQMALLRMRSAKHRRIAALIRSLPIARAPSIPPGYRVILHPFENAVLLASMWHGRYSSDSCFYCKVDGGRDHPQSWLEMGVSQAWAAYLGCTIARHGTNVFSVRLSDADWNVKFA